MTQTSLPLGRGYNRRTKYVGLVFDRALAGFYVYRPSLPVVKLDWKIPSFTVHGRDEGHSKLTQLIRDLTGLEDVFWTNLMTAHHGDVAEIVIYSVIDTAAEAFISPDGELKFISLNEMWLDFEIDDVMRAAILLASHSLKSEYIVPFTVHVAKKNISLRTAPSKERAVETEPLDTFKY